MKAQTRAVTAEPSGLGKKMAGKRLQRRENINKGRFYMGFPAAQRKESTYNVGDMGSVPGWEDPWKMK